MGVLQLFTKSMVTHGFLVHAPIDEPTARLGLMTPVTISNLGVKPDVLKLNLSDHYRRSAVSIKDMGTDRNIVVP